MVREAPPAVVFPVCVWACVAVLDCVAPSSSPIAEGRRTFVLRQLPEVLPRGLVCTRVCVVVRESSRACVLPHAYLCVFILLSSICGSYGCGV